MHHITPFSDEKFINFLGRGTQPLPRPTPLAAYAASILASSALDLRPPPNVPVALTPMSVAVSCLYRVLKTCLCRIFLQSDSRAVLPAPALSSKPAGRRFCCLSTGQRDRQTDGRTTRPFHDAYRLQCGSRT